MRNFTITTPRTLSGGLWFVEAAVGGGKVPARSLAAGLGRGRTHPGAGDNSCRRRPACPTVTRSIKPIRTLGGSVNRLAAPKTRGNSRVPGRIGASLGRVALGVGSV